MVRSLSSSKERHRQDARMHRSHNHQSLSPVRTLQDGGCAQRFGSAPPQRLHVEDEHVGFLLASVDRGSGPLVLPLSVRRKQIRMYGNAIRSRFSSSYRNKVLTAGHSVSPATAGPMYGIHRRCVRDGSEQSKGSSRCSAGNQQASPAGLQKSMMLRMQTWNDRASLSPRVIQELEWWLSELKSWNGKSAVPQKHMLYY